MDDQWDERPLYISIDLSCWEYCLFTSFFSFSVAHTRLYLLVALSYNSLTILLLLVAPTSSHLVISSPQPPSVIDYRPKTHT